jgi:hypothetical protein
MLSLFVECLVGARDQIWKYRPLSYGFTPTSSRPTVTVPSVAIFMFFFFWGVVIQVAYSSSISYVQCMVSRGYKFPQVLNMKTSLQTRLGTLNVLC